MSALPYSILIADLHLSATTPALNQGFVALMQSPIIQNAERLYILGDFVEFWIGDDMPLTGMEAVFAALGDIGSKAAPRVFFQHGNRDFLVGAEFAKQYQLTLLGDYERLDLYGRTVLLCHGDTLCSDDVKYQAFRQMVRDPKWQQQAMQLPIAERIKMAEQIRSQTSQDMRSKSDEIMDVNEATVLATFAQFDVSHIIHGHTHRPAVHHYPPNLTRIVLSDWNHANNQQGQYLYADQDKLELCDFAL